LGGESGSGQGMHLKKEKGAREGRKASFLYSRKREEMGRKRKKGGEGRER